MDGWITAAEQKNRGKCREGGKKRHAVIWESVKPRRNYQKKSLSENASALGKKHHKVKCTSK